MISWLLWSSVGVGLLTLAALCCWRIAMDSDRRHRQWRENIAREEERRQSDHRHLED